MLSINCLHGHDHKKTVTIEVSGSKTVSTLKEMIKQKFNTLRNIGQTDISLTKVSLSVECLDRCHLQDLSYGEFMHPVALLSELFSELTPGHLHVIVRTHLQRHQEKRNLL